MERIVTAYRTLGVFSSLKLKVYLCTLSFSKRREIYGTKIDFALGWRLIVWLILSGKSLKVVHVHTMSALLIFMPLCIFSNKKLVYHIHSWQQTRGLSLLVLKVFKGLKISVISVNREISEVLIKKTGISILTLYNFIEGLNGSRNVAFKSLRDRAVSLGYVGRFTKEKGVLSIVDQIKFLECQGMRIEKLHLYGSGALTTRVMDILERDCIGLEVLYCKDVFDQKSIYVFDILLLPSPEESFSLVMHEALVRGIRVFAASDNLIKSVPSFFKSAKCISNVGDFDMQAFSVDLDSAYAERFDFKYHIRSLERMYGFIMSR